MRTKRQHNETQVTTMMNQVKTTLRRSRSTLIEDAAGAAALTIMLIAALYMPIL